MGFTHVTRLRYMTCFMSFDWFLVRCAVDSWESADGFHIYDSLWVMSSCDAEYESHRDRVVGRTPFKGALAA